MNSLGYIIKFLVAICLYNGIIFTASAATPEPTGTYSQKANTYCSNQCINKGHTGGSFQTTVTKPTSQPTGQPNPSGGETYSWKAGSAGCICTD